MVKKIIAEKIYVYESLIALFVTTLIVSNIASIKLVGEPPIVFDAGTLLFPLAYILGDIITEVYGFKKMRRILLISIVMLLMTTMMFWLVGLLPPNSEWGMQASYEAILGTVWRIVAASVVAIFLGEMINAYVLAKLKVQTKGRGLWYRLIGSSTVGNAVDTSLFSIIAFAGTVSAGTLLSIIGTVYIIKMIAEIVLSPLTILIINRIKSSTGIDQYESPDLLHTKA